MTVIDLYREIVEFDEKGGIVENKRFVIKGEELSELKIELGYVIKAIQSLNCVEDGLLGR